MRWRTPNDSSDNMSSTGEDIDNRRETLTINIVAVNMWPLFQFGLKMEGLSGIKRSKEFYKSV